MSEIFTQASFTAKMLTQEMVEGKTPICHLIQNYSQTDKENVYRLLYRCQKLFEAKQEVSRVLKLLIRLTYSDVIPGFNPKNQLERLNVTLKQFLNEHHIYDSVFTYRGFNIGRLLERIEDGEEGRSLGAILKGCPHSSDGILLVTQESPRCEGESVEIAI